MALTKVQDGGLNLTSAGLPAGSVLQVVQGTSTSTFQQSSNNSSQDVGLSASITPSATSSKVFIMTSAPIVLNNPSDAIFYLVRGSSNIVPMNLFASTGYISSSQNFAYLDSPSTTSSTTYKVMCEKDQNELFYNYINEATSIASIVLMEIAG